jgi:Glycosyl hydrolases family 2, TIM barrel domain/Glycosyl hydrolases family 2, sugar binding domain/Glycosyl hydrolases family 2
MILGRRAIVAVATLLLGCLVAVARPGPLPLTAAKAEGPVYAASPPTPGALYRDGQAGRFLLGGEWLYRADPGDQGIAAGWWNDLAATDGWSIARVPGAYNAGDLSSASNNGSVGWYRRDFTLPAHAFASYVPAAGRRWIIRFESVNYRATVWLNGRVVGSHTGAYLPFEFDLHPRAGINRLIVRVDDRRGAGDLPPGPISGWWNYGGLLREVYLRAVQRADIENLRLRTSFPCPRCTATIREQAWIRNLTGTPQRVTLRGRFGRLRLDFGQATLAPHASWTAHATALQPHPRLWAPGHPTLYKATLTLSDAQGRRLGGYTTYAGIRSIKVNAAGHLTLNGHLLDLRGAFIHEQNYLTGAALSPAQLGALMGWERELGSDVIRSHYPLNPEILEMADRYGMLVWDEIPVYQVADQYLGSAAWRASAYSMLRQNILDNQNHPSVMLWSIANELPTAATANEAGYIAGAAALGHRLDPTRPIGMAISSWPGVACQPAYAPLDVIGYNDYFGWYDAGGGTTDDRDGLSPYLDSLRACYPKKALMVTEFGFEASRPGPVEQHGTYEFQADAAAFHLGVFASKPWLSGAIYFDLQDFAVQPGWTGDNPLPDPPWLQKGLIDRYGAPKPAFSLISAIYHRTVQVGPASRGR